ncbi:hypothetical protein ABZ896_37580 [Streptomyces sp. NPDC047072]|uniref:hypothetical protein n=1 Tax=Streptomyces sp. NPDC047072 TaxID=3154809 RepID=UPI0033D7C2EF
MTGRRVDRCCSGHVARGVVVSVGGGPSFTALAGTGTAVVALVGGAVPPGSVWPSVVLWLGAMAYDLGVRALRDASDRPVRERGRS